jgi:hypothetical protein
MTDSKAKTRAMSSYHLFGSSELLLVPLLVLVHESYLIILWIIDKRLFFRFLFLFLFLLIRVLVLFADVVAARAPNTWSSARHVVGRVLVDYDLRTARTVVDVLALTSSDRRRRAEFDGRSFALAWAWSLSSSSSSHSSSFLFVLLFPLVADDSVARDVRYPLETQSIPSESSGGFWIVECQSLLVVSQCNVVEFKMLLTMETAVAWLL